MTDLAFILIMSGCVFALGAVAGFALGRFERERCENHLRDFLRARRDGEFSA